MKSRLRINEYFVFIFSFAILLSSCADNTLETLNLNKGFDTQLKSAENKYRYSYKTEEASILDISKDKGVKVDKNDEDLILQIEFQTNFYVSDELRNSNQLDSHLEENIEELDGLLLHYENSKLAKITIVEDGFATDEEYENLYYSDGDDDYPLRNECSYAGIQDCVQYAVYEEWSTFHALSCSFSRPLRCIALEAAACIASNCI